MLNQLGIGKRLGLGFGLLVLLLLAAAGVALGGFHALDQAMQEVKHQELQIITTKDASARILKVMTTTSALLAAQAPETQRQLLQALQAEEKAYRADFDLLEAVATTRETHRQLAALAADLGQTLESNHQAVSLALRGQRALALQHFATVSCQAVPGWSARFDALVARRQERLLAAQAQSAAVVRRGILAMVGTGLAAVAAAALLGYGLTRGITTPVHDFMGVLEQVATGNLTVRARVGSQDEIGRLGASLNRTLQVLEETLRDVARASMTVASGATQLSASAEEMAGTTQGLAESGERLNLTTGSVAVHIAGFLASVDQVGINVAASVGQAEQAVQATLAGALGSEDTASELARICEATRSIARAVSIIQDIAQQTHLLSFNAAIEAAHAGERGRGFLVVAEEVRRLADLSRQAALEITELIGQTETVMAGGVASMQKTSGLMGRIQGSIAQVTERIKAIGTATREQNAAGEEISQRMAESEQEVGRNATATVQLAAAVEQVSHTAAELAAVAESMFTAVGKFRFS